MRILHLIATGQRRGAEVFASDLIAALDAPDLDQRVAVLHGDPPWAVAFGVPSLPPSGPGRGRSHPWALWPLCADGCATGSPTWSRPTAGEALKYAALATLVRGAPIVYRRIGSVSWLSSGPRRALYGRLVRRADRVVAVAGSMHGRDRGRLRAGWSWVVTIPNGVDLRPAGPPTGAGRRPESPSGIALGRRRSAVAGRA